MDETPEEWNPDWQLTKSCYKYNKTIDNRVESCDTLINKENSCFAIWEFNDIDRIIGKRPLNLTEISQSSKLSLKGKRTICSFCLFSKQCLLITLQISFDPKKRLLFRPAPVKRSLQF